MSPEELIDLAKTVREHAYCPYSRFAVGAAIETAQGRVYSGCNVENVSFGLSICAERAAVFAALAEGDRQWRALAVVSSDGSVPCGACRQVLAEFADPELRIHIATPDGRYRTHTLGDLYPNPFKSPLVQ